MRLPEDEEKYQMTPTVVSAVVAVTLFVTIILVVVLVLNNKGSGGQKPPQPPQAVAASSGASQYPDTNQLLTGSTLTPDDFDFWDMYPEEETVADTQQAAPTVEPVENDPSTDGKHTLVKGADGKEEWLLISPYLPKNNYDTTKLVCQSNLMKYYEDGRQVSFVGADISKYQDYVDFMKLKKAGVDFVMLRVGARGYSSGELVLDDYFTDNLKRANDAGLKIGVYFFSQAVSGDEAIAEANMVLENIRDHQITYPIAFDMEYVENDTSRVEALSKAEKTAVAKAFLDTVKAAGYKPMLYGDKEWLLKKIDLAKLTSYDVWLSQQEDVPDYPYQFTMWQYTTSASIDGIAGYADLNISFVDYAEK